MSHLDLFTRMVWMLNIALEAGLLALLCAHRTYRIFPAFFGYIAADVLQSGLMIFLYSRFGTYSQITSSWGWASQAVVVALRTLAVVEVCRHILGGYRGIWALVRRMLLAVGAVIAVYSTIQSLYSGSPLLLNADRGAELGIATVIVGIFVVIRYYQLAVPPPVHFVAVGFCVFSALRVLNDTVLERWLSNYRELWVAVSLLTFTATASAWIWVFRRETSVAPVREMLPAATYSAMIPEINLQLRRVNQRLGEFFKVEEPSL